VPQRVPAHLFELGMFEELMKPPSAIGWIDWRAEGAREYKIVIDPTIAGALSGEALSVPLALQGL
jgi:hypothetical protein